VEVLSTMRLELSSTRPRAHEVYRSGGRSIGLGVMADELRLDLVLQLARASADNEIVPTGAKVADQVKLIRSIPSHENPPNPRQA
jgi:hypothetical protein